MPMMRPPVSSTSWRSHSSKMASRAFLGIEISTLGCLDLNISGAPYGTNGTTLLRCKDNPLQLKITVERMDCAVSPDDVVFLDKCQVLWRFCELSCDGVQDKARMKRSNKRDVDRQPRRVFDLRYLHAVNLVPLFFRNQVDLAYTLAEFGTLQNRLQ